jgi:hypothetical protein
MDTVTMESVSDFMHKPSAGGTFDSICRKCYATVANEKHEENLVSSESGHDCMYPRVGEKF